MVLLECATALCLLILGTFAAEPEVCVLRADGSEVCGPISSWDEAQIVVGTEPSQRIPINDLSELRFPQAKRRAQTSDWIVLGTGDRFPLTIQRVADDVVTAGWARASRRPELSFPLENVAAVIRQMPPAAVVQRDWLSTIHRLPAGSDTVRLIAGEDLTGEFVAWENGLLKWQAALGAIQLDLQRVRWIRFDPELTARPPRPDRAWHVFLVDGTRFTASACQPQADHTVTWTLPVGGMLTVPRHEIVKATLWTARRATLSQRKPLAVKLTPFLNGDRDVVLDHSVAQAPLSLRGEEFTTGIAMQSRAEVTYAIQPADSHFTACVGIDDVAERHGSARFAVRIDDRVVWTSDELTGTSAAVRVPPIPLTDGKTLTLVVDFGEYADVADFADWCDASIWQIPPRE